MDKLEYLRKLDLTDYESRALNSLLKLKSSTPKELSLDSGVPQNKLYQILKKFENLGILSQIPGEPKKYKLINFKTFVDKRIKQKESQLKNLKKHSRNFKNLKDFGQQFIFSLIRGQQAIMDRISEKNSEVKKEIFGAQRSWKVWGKGLREMKKSIKKGVDVRLIGVVDNETIKRATEWKKIGCKIKKYNKKFGENPLRFTIFDNKEARITLGKPEISRPKDYITFWTTSKPLITLLRKQFLEMWKECDKF